VPLEVELLEHRCLMSGNPPPWPTGLVPQQAAAPVATLDQALVLQLLPAASGPVVQGGAAGTIGNAANGGGVDWYQFTLTSASQVVLNTVDGQGGLVSVLTLYNTEAPDPNYPFDFNSPPYDALGHRALAQDDGASHGGDALISRDLAPGTYYVAVSGSGNSYFHPLLADSGYPGATGAYRLLVTATDLGLTAADGPAVLAVESSPLVVRVDLSAPIDPTTVTLDPPGALPTDPPGTVRLTYNPTGNFGDGNDQIVSLAGFHFSPDAAELQLKPQTPLAPGFYRLFLAGDPQGGLVPVLMDPTDTLNLGQDATHAGQDSTTDFQIAGPTATDTPATAQDLGDVTTAGRVQTAGTIGDDPNLANPAAEVDLYHFQISGPGLYAFSAEVFAGRIGSTLDPGISLYRVDLSNPAHPLVLVAANDNSRNATPTSTGSALPLFTDPVLVAGLTAGNYYLAVSGTQNVPGVGPGTDPGTNGIFDPNVSESGVNGFTTGAYVLNVLVQPALPSPSVVSTSPVDGSTLAAPPTHLTVRFNGPVNLLQLANTAFNATSDSSVAGVFVIGADGKQYFPRLESYDDATNTATFLMLDALPAGVNALHLSGALGLTGFGGNPLLGNDPSGDYVVRFTVAGPPRGTGGNPLLWTEQEPNDSAAAPQDLGVLFESELQAGVTIQGSLTATDVDYFQIQVLQDGVYHFTLTGSSDPVKGPTPAPAGVVLAVTDAAGTPVLPIPQNNPNALFAQLAAGTYFIRVSGAPAGYEIHITIIRGPENPPPLTAGAAPALRIRLADPTPPPAPTPPPPPVSLPPAGGTPYGPSLPPGFVISLVNFTVSPLGGDLVGKTTGGTVEVDVAGTGPMPLFANVPLDATLALRVAPVGGVTDGSGAVQIAGPTLVQISGPASLLIVSRTSYSSQGANGVGDGLLPAALRNALSALLPLWQHLVDALFSGNGRATTPPSPRGPEDGASGGNSPEASGEGGLEEVVGIVAGDDWWAAGEEVPDFSPATCHASPATRLPGWAFAGALLAGGLFGLTRPLRQADVTPPAAKRRGQPDDSEP
jgi:hypothetical protein